jgi:hypothetical protein
LLGSAIEKKPHLDQRERERQSEMQVGNPNFWGYAHNALPTNQFQTQNVAPTPVNSFMQHEMHILPDAKWDSGGLLGCCANDRGCKGCMDCCYSCCCMCWVQTDISIIIERLHGSAAFTNPWSSAQGLAPGMASRTKTSDDDSGTTAVFAAKMQNMIPRNRRFNTCELCAMSYFCPGCMTAWTWHTAQNLENMAASKARELMDRMNKGQGR